MYTIEVLTPEMIIELWPNIRKVDKKEAILQGITDNNYLECLMKADHLYAGCYNGKIVSAFGSFVSPNVVWLWCCATKDLYRHMDQTTIIASEYINMMKIKYPLHRIAVQVWKGHLNSIKWLKALGFEKTYDLPFTSEIVMEIK